MVVNFPGTNSSSHWLLWGQDLKTLKILFTPEHFKIANGKMLMIRKGVLHNSNSKKIRSNKLKRVLYTGTASSFWFFLYSVGKKKKRGGGKKKYEKPCCSISVWMYYNKHFFQIYCFALLYLHFPLHKCYIPKLPDAFHSVTWFVTELLSFVWTVTPPYVSSILVPLTLLPTSPVSEGNSHYIKTSQWKPCWNSPLK